MRAPWILVLLMLAPLAAEAAPVTECQNLTVSDVYTLESNVNSSGTCFRLQAHNITLDCAGYTINYSQSAVGNAVDANTFAASNGTIENCNIVQGSAQANGHAINYGGDDGIVRNNTIVVQSTSDGVALASGTERTWIHGNNITTETGEGVEFNGGDYNNITDNIVTTTGAGGYGISIQSNAYYNNIINNTITTLDASIPGMIIDNSIGLIIINNTISSNSRGIWLNGISTDLTVVHNITGNTLNNRPILYIANQDGYVFEDNNSIGQLIIANSTNVILRNLDGQNASFGLFHARNFTVENVNLTNSRTLSPLEIRYSHGGVVFNSSIVALGAVAILFDNSQNNTLHNNTLMSNESVIHIQASNRNVIHNNTITGNGTFGRYAVNFNSNSQYNEFLDNNVTALASAAAISAGGTDNNNLTRNTITAIGSVAAGILLGSSAANWTITYNVIKTVYRGVEVGSNSDAVIAHNNISTNSSNNGLYLVDSGSYIVGYRNRISSQSSYAVRLTGEGGSVLYDNYFFSNSSTIPVLTDTDVNAWNTTRTNGTNIIGGPAIGGNWYGNTAGSWSQNCTDADFDAFCDTPYTLASGNIDYLVLTNDTGPWFANATPAGQTFSPGVSVPIGIVIQEVYIDTVAANVTLPNGSVELLILTQESNSHNATYPAPFLLGTYTVGFYVNDTIGNENSTNTTFIVNDTSAPTQTFIVTVSNQSAEIFRNASEASNLSINYGTTLSLGTLAQNDTLLANLTLTLPGLEAGTLYYYNATSCDTFGNCATNPSNFTTSSNIPLISELAPVPATTTATITWTTSFPSNSSVSYGLTTQHDLEASSNGSTTSHSITLTGLASGTTYSFNVTSCTPSACNVTGPNSFTTGTTSSGRGSSAGVPAAVSTTGSTFTLSRLGRHAFLHDGRTHYVRIKELLETRVIITFTSDPVDVTLGEGEGTDVDITGDGLVDVYVVVNAITEASASFTLTAPESTDAPEVLHDLALETNEEVPTKPAEAEPDPQVPAVGESPAAESQRGSGAILLVALVAVLGLCGAVLWYFSKK